MPFAPLDHALLSVAESRAADHAAEAAGTPSFALMQRAGAGVAQAVQARWTPRPVLVLVGPGGNGGDGYIAAQRLAEAGWPVRIASTIDRARLKGDAALAAADWREEAPVLDRKVHADKVIGDAQIVIDALYGAGLNKPLDTVTREVLRAAERSCAVVSIDVPSGLAGDTARELGYAPRADLTVALHRKRPAHLLEPGRSFCGETVVVDIGAPAPVAPRLVENHPDLWIARFPWPNVDAHKGERGRLIVVWGPPHSRGAARLAARAALRVGAGLVTVASPPDSILVNAAHLTAVMLKPFENEEELLTLAEPVDAVVIGPAAGVTEDTRLNVLACCRTGAAMVVDADALTVFRDDPDELFSALDRDDVLTPHPGEFERLFPGLLKGSASRVEAARRAVELTGSVVVLKGADTVIAAPDGRAAINGNGAPWLATAGSGDVLSGLIAGLIAQGMASFDAACAGVWIHGEAGRTFGPGLISEDLPERTPAVLRDLQALS